MGNAQVTEYIDGMGKRGLSDLTVLWWQLLGEDEENVPYFIVFRVPLAASEEAHRKFKARYDKPPKWDEIREDHGPGRYEVVLMGLPPKRTVNGVKGLIRKGVLRAFPWLDAEPVMVPRGRACAAMFDTIDFGMIKPPVPKPLGEEQPTLFNPEELAIPKYVAGSDTSFMAAENIAPFVNKLQKMVLDVVLLKGTDGATCDEVEVELEMPHQTASARINELMAATDDRPQMLFDSGSRRKTRHGQLATIWIHRDVVFG
jgi:hypothetical protein